MLINSKAKKLNSKTAVDLLISLNPHRFTTQFDPECGIWMVITIIPITTSSGGHVIMQCLNKI